MPLGLCIAETANTLHRMVNTVANHIIIDFMNAMKWVPMIIVHTEKGKLMDESKLKPCPFCAAPNTNLYFVNVDAPHGYDTVGIFCNFCKQTVILEENEWEGDSVETRDKATEAWNRRANDE